MVHLKKQSRVIDKEFLAVVSRLPCICCASLLDEFRCEVGDFSLDWPVISDPDHVTTRGAGGGDTPTNVMPLCRKHHTERHMIGIGSMISKYPAYKTWLQLAERTDILDQFDMVGDLN